jgi:hypothetical protein
MSFETDPVLRAILRAGLALLFLAAASHKLRDLAAFARTLDAYELVPAPLVHGAAVCLVAMEVAAAALLILSASAFGPAATAALLVLYSIAIGANLARGRSDLECGCSLGPSGQKLSWWLVGRNSALLCGALLATLPPSARTMTWIDAFTVAACTAALLLLYHVVENLLARQMELSAFVQRWEPEPPTASSAGGG